MAKEGEFRLTLHTEEVTPTGELTIDDIIELHDSGVQLGQDVMARAAHLIMEMTDEDRDRRGAKFEALRDELQFSMVDFSAELSLDDLLIDDLSFTNAGPAAFTTHTTHLSVVNPEDHPAEEED